MKEFFRGILDVFGAIFIGFLLIAWFHTLLEIPGCKQTHTVSFQSAQEKR